MTRLISKRLFYLFSLARGLNKSTLEQNESVSLIFLASIYLDNNVSLQGKFISYNFWKIRLTITSD